MLGTLSSRSIGCVLGLASISGFLHEVTDVETVDDEVRLERGEITLQLDVGKNGGVTVDSAVQHLECRPFARAAGPLVEQGFEHHRIGFFVLTPFPMVNESPSVRIRNTPGGFFAVVSAPRSPSLLTRCVYEKSFCWIVEYESGSSLWCRYSSGTSAGESGLIRMNPTMASAIRKKTTVVTAAIQIPPRVRRCGVSCRSQESMVKARKVPKTTKPMMAAGPNELSAR